MVMAIGKAGKHDHGTWQRIFFALDKFKLCRVPARGHSTKIFFLKKFKLCRALDRGHSAKNF